ncbi:Acid shock protein [Lactiplantibacillus plantarum]|uniref:Hsp20/alpha crystallin family protein n=1 Tax=Lactiplantibacillus plantarum TaxID=1590 RepID=UPI000CF90684|nr:Hsp20/alpha crystallin family protein [Lactiplantibacillus plantarum]SPE09067.1 Acid shock protein [Lactiplantibacillus plantarum]SPE13627.1 Acid shock protein [Lactiplantibacillus plantarum]SPH08354.1 Acid shock protein [Lactiplantibacillus plantarum]SPH10882.1 Acid shock protein [Lactiplantibacillus plantarum]
MANEVANRFNDMFHDWDRFFSDFNNFLPGFTSDMQQLKSDVVDKDDHYELAVELPGVDKKDINLNYRNGSLIITAQKNVSTAKKDEKGQIMAQERSTGRLQRSYYLPNVDSEKIKAQTQNGVLKISLPKTKESSGHQIKIE